MDLWTEPTGSDHDQSRSKVAAASHSSVRRSKIRPVRACSRQVRWPLARRSNRVRFHAGPRRRQQCRPVLQSSCGDLGRAAQAVRQLSQNSLLLCDVQGAEVEALRGAANALAARRVRFLVISTHHHQITGDPLTHQRCVGLLRDAGAHFIAEHSVSESCSGDGLVVVSTDPRDVVCRLRFPSYGLVKRFSVNWSGTWQRLGVAMSGSPGVYLLFVQHCGARGRRRRRRARPLP